MTRFGRIALATAAFVLPVAGLILLSPEKPVTAAETPATPADAPEVAPSIGKRVGEFKRVDPRTNKSVALSDFAEKKAVAVVFLGTMCPINNSYLPRLNRLQTELGGQAQIVGINSNSTDSAKSVTEHAIKHDLKFPVLKDTDGLVARQFGAMRTPEVFVLDAKGEVIYHGRIDDQYGLTPEGFDVRRIQPSTADLADALKAVIAGKSVAVAETPISGCYITKPPKPKATATLTYAQHIAPLLHKHCNKCHRDGQIGPMDLTNYDEVSQWAEMIKEVIDDQRMPPWYADTKVGHFVNDRSMPKADAQMIVKWIDDGCPKGDTATTPPLKPFSTAEWTIGKPDKIITMAEPYQVPAEMPKRGIPYQVFIIDPKFTEDVWVQAAEAKAGAPSVVHHILAFIAPPLDRVDPNVPEFPFLPFVKNARVLCGTAPGDMPTMFPPGAAIHIPAGSQIIIQMHYTPNGKAETDRSSLGLIFCKEPPKRQVLTIPVFNPRVRIPAGESNHRMDSYFTALHKGEILSYMPHMHLRGKDFSMALQKPDKSETMLLNVPRFNFNWQNVYRNVTPVQFQKGDVIHCVAHYDNSTKNPNNPDPKREVRWGDQTWEEMMIGWMDIVYDIPVK